MTEPIIPFEATPASLHFRLKAIEDKVDKLPEQVLNAIKGHVPSKEDCDKRHLKLEDPTNEAEPGINPSSYKQIFAWVFAIGTLIGSAIYGYKNAPTMPVTPQITNTQPAQPQPTAGGGSGS